MGSLGLGLVPASPIITARRDYASVGMWAGGLTYPIHRIDSTSDAKLLALKNNAVDEATAMFTVRILIYSQRYLQLMALPMT